MRDTKATIPPEYAEILRRPVRFRVVERRSPLVEKIVRDNGLAAPKVVRCEPLPWCQPKRCFVNVETQVARRGGTLETGWIFKEYEDRVLLTEAHAVWVDWSGKRHDITPHQFAPTTVLFSPDPKVAAKRGFTRHHILLLSSDERVLAIERFAFALRCHECENFAGFGREIVLPAAKMEAMAMQAKLPVAIANHLVELRSAQSYAEAALIQ